MPMPPARLIVDGRTYEGNGEIEDSGVGEFTTGYANLDATTETEAQRAIPNTVIEGREDTVAEFEGQVSGKHNRVPVRITQTITDEGSQSHRARLERRWGERP